MSQTNSDGESSQWPTFKQYVSNLQRDALGLLRIGAFTRGSMILGTTLLSACASTSLGDSKAFQSTAAALDSAAPFVMTATDYALPVGVLGLGVCKALSWFTESGVPETVASTVKEEVETAVDAAKSGAKKFAARVESVADAGKEEVKSVKIELHKPITVTKGEKVVL